MRAPVEPPAVAEAPADLSESPVVTGPQRWAPVWRPAAIFAASRAVTLLAAAMAAKLSPTLGIGGVLTGMWDSGWYRNVAQLGYPTSVPEQAGRAAQSTIGFFPLHPLAMRLVHHLGLSLELAGLVVTALAGLTACLLLWRLVAHLSTADAADRAVALFCFFPGAMVLSLAYSEALMLALAVGCLLALVKERWMVAGVLAALATATRPNALALVAACAWAAATAIWRRRQWRALAAPLLAPLGLLAFFGYLARHTGEAGAYLRTQREGWDQTLQPKAAFDTLSQFVHRPFDDTNIAVMTLGSVFLVVALVVLLRSRPPGVLLVYTLAVLGMALLTPTMGARPRFLLTAFPLVTTLGEDLPPAAFAVLVGSFATVLGAFTVLSLASPWATP
jgi:hypothetical protein